jgi:cytochrome c-type biogenesis protein CcmH
MRWRNAAALCACLVVLAAGASEAQTNLREVSDDLVCQCGCNMVLSNCTMQNCGSAIPMREEIEKQIASGDSKDAIVASFVEKVGLKVLAAPPAKGFNLSAWILPFVALVVGGVIALKVMRSWRAKTAAVESGRAPVSFPASHLSDQQRQRIERELQDFES